jgi:hypothetical protein
MVSVSVTGPRPWRFRSISRLQKRSVRSLQGQDSSLGGPDTFGAFDMAPTRAEVALVQLKNCLVNLPSSLVSVLSNANTVRHAG